MQGIDATDPGAILAAFNGPQGFKPVTVGILQAIAAGRSANLADATAAVIVNASTNQTVSLIPFFDPQSKGTGKARGW